MHCTTGHSAHSFRNSCNGGRQKMGRRCGGVDPLRPRLRKTEAAARFGWGWLLYIHTYIHTPFILIDSIQSDVYIQKFEDTHYFHLHIHAWNSAYSYPRIQPIHIHTYIHTYILYIERAKWCMWERIYLLKTLNLLVENTFYTVTFIHLHTYIHAGLPRLDNGFGRLAAHHPSGVLQ